MKAKLSATAIGAILTCICSGALAQATATTTQQGIGNTAYTEQIELFGSSITATIEQIGNNNRAGDPVTKTPGIFQDPQTGGAVGTATIRQHGDENAARITQERMFSTVRALIQQVGNNNTAAISQDFVQGIDRTSLTQNGDRNVARIEQLNTIDSAAGVTGIQNGSENFLSFRQERGQFGAGIGIQNGFRNSATINLDGFAAVGIVEQDGSMNSATIGMQDVDETRSSVRQIGTGNTASSTQQSTVFPSSSDIVQDGNNNLATVRQILGSNEALIAQIGNNNSATVAQTGICGGPDRNVASIRQVGDGFVASITQAGAGNLAGIYQH